MLDPLDEHYGYLSDRVKLERYQAAIERVVRPGHVVVDLGCGSGLLGLMALRSGAGKVIFVEEGSVIEVARRTIVEAGFEDKAEFYRVSSYELDLPAPADVIMCDHVGYFGFDYGILELLADAKERFLKPDGVVIPARFDLRLAAIEAGNCRDLVGRWRDGSVPEDFAWVSTPAANTKHAINVKSANLLGEPATLATVALGAEVGDFLSWTTETGITRDGTIDGLLGWFDCLLIDNIRMTNAPTADDALDRAQAFLPLDEPIAVRKGESVRATVMVRSAEQILAWIVELPEQGRQFSQSTFNGLLLDDEALDRSRPDRVARLNDRGLARQIVLSYCDGLRTVAEVEALVKQHHPDLFPSVRAAEKFIRRVLTWDTDG